MSMMFSFHTGASHFGKFALPRPTPSPSLGEGELDSKSLSQTGRGIKARLQKLL